MENFEVPLVIRKETFGLLVIFFGLYAVLPSSVTKHKLVNFWYSII